MRTSGRFFLVATLLLVVACMQPAAAPPAAPDTRAEDAATIRAAVESWSAAAQAKDAEAFVSVYADDAVLMLEGAPDLVGIEAIREGTAGMMQDPNFDLSFAADNVVVARAGDQAYETGTYRLTMSDAGGSAATQVGHYVVLWEKLGDGSWKVVRDVPVSDPPPAPEGETDSE
jgi:uncharacterized protein (TIGR02246 family)